MFSFSAKGKNIILTGPPRSGTTLTCFLLNKLPNVVALDEPMRVMRMEGYSETKILKEVGDFFKKNRKSILRKGEAQSKNLGGKMVENPYAKRDQKEGLRRVHQGLANRGMLSIEKTVNKDFSLLIKHPSAFTALLPALTKKYPCYAIVRNPVATIASWSSIEIPANNGHAPAAEIFNAELKSNLTAIKDRVKRQVFLLNWYFEQYQQFLQKEHVLFYEDMIRTGGKSLSAIDTTAENLNESLTSKNKNPDYDEKVIAVLQEELKQSQGAMWNYYHKEEAIAIF